MRTHGSNGTTCPAKHYVPKMGTSNYYWYYVANNYYIIFQIVVAFHRDSKYFLLCFDTLSNVLYFI